MEKAKKKKWIIISCIVIILIIIDQITKVICYTNQEVISNMIKFTTVENRGGAFGVGQNSTFSFIVTNIVVIGIILRFMITQQEQIDKKTYTALCLVTAGGISNLIDRIIRGYVVDFIDISQLIPSFPVFNFADICIVVGWILLAACFAFFTYDVTKGKKKRKIE